MPIKVLIVDDSRFYRNRLCDWLAEDPEIKVIGTAGDGREAVDKVMDLKPDVVVMDIEMPGMDGISAVREIMKIHPIPILMFSSLTSRGAQVTLDALEAGAVDFVLKRLGDKSLANATFGQEVRIKIRAVARRTLPPLGLEPRLDSPVEGRNEREATRRHPARAPSGEKLRLSNYKIIAIGASTGGPSAIQAILTALPKMFPVPIVIVQHMPAAFTGAFARRLDAICELSVKEADDGDEILPGRVYIAPGGKQMLIEEHGGKKVIGVKDSEAKVQYKPSVDVSLLSISKAYGEGVFAIILTGMGLDGRNGSAALKKLGSTIWAQDEQSCVVYGMPHAIVEAGLADRELSITEIARQLASGV